MSILYFGEKWKMDAPTEICQQTEEQQHDCKNEVKNYCKTNLYKKVIVTCDFILHVWKCWNMF